MSDPSATSSERAATATQALFARAADADVQARRALRHSIDDALLPEDERLDDRTRAALGALLDTLTGTLEGELREYAARLLTTRGEPALAALLRTDAAPVIDRLTGAGLLRDDQFMSECLARVRLELLGEALPLLGGREADGASLLARLALSSDRVVATAAGTLMTAESVRRDTAEGRAASGTGLPRALHARLLWWVAAVLRERAIPLAGDRIDALDRALAEAALRNLSAQDDAATLETVATRLAAAIDAQSDELAALIEEALYDRRLPLIAALIAHAFGFSYQLARELLIDPRAERLWLALRALDLPRDLIARLGYALCEADPRRDVEAFADQIDLIVAVDAAAARAAVAPLTLHPDYRAALLALADGTTQ
ncbi:DUF2336 domain-containing protein [Sphingomonas guangdongensis]|nr:DUF2336 domain-containing protein [Sphingomonas guangdongensis]